MKKSTELGKAVWVFENDEWVVHIPLKMKRMGGRKQIILPKGVSSDVLNKSVVNNQLALNIAKAFAFKDGLENETFKSVQELADKLKVTRQYINQVLKLTLLAPDIIRIILDGNEPDGLSIVKLREKIPLIWDEQKKIICL